MAEVINTIGRRKRSIARIYMSEGNGSITVNNKSFEAYFPMEWHRNNILSPVVISENDGKYDVKVKLAGGGVTGQAEALRLALAKAMVILDPENKSDLRKAGLVTRDARVVERKKFGKRKARKTAQFSKR